jgi:hypothetical protein
MQFSCWEAVGPAFVPIKQAAATAWMRQSAGDPMHAPPQT